MKTKQRSYRHKRITKKFRSSAVLARLTVFRSKKHISAYLVNEGEKKVLTGVSTMAKEFRSLGIKASGQEAARQIGRMIAAKAGSMGIKDISFDRCGYIYHGRIRSLAEGAREGGLKF